MSLAMLLPIIGNVLDKIFPNKEAADAAKLRLLELQQQGELAELTAITELSKAQTEVNIAEASSESLYKGCWRPTIGYVCAAALAYHYIVYPLLVFTMLYIDPAVKVPASTMDGYMWELIFGMLGLGIMRSWEKKRKYN